MALTSGNKITASDFNNLKTRVNNEMARRCYTGSLASYNTSVSVNAGQTATAAQANSIINGVRAINTSGLPASASKGSSIVQLNTLSSKLSDYAGREKVGSSSGCASNCSGLCQGCTGTCTGGCTGSCSGSCTSCSGNCSGDCKGCSGCGSGCAGGCWGCGGQCSGSSCGWKGL